MSGEEKENRPKRKSVDERLVDEMRAIFGSRTATERFIRLLSDAREIAAIEMAQAIETAERPEARVMYLAGVETAYRDLTNAAIRALAPEDGQPPSGGPPESAASAPV